MIKGAADVAQPAEQPPCKRQVAGSSPAVGSLSLVGRCAGPRQAAGQTARTPLGSSVEAV